jgi:hypothetical protein
MPRIVQLIAHNGDHMPPTVPPVLRFSVLGLALLGLAMAPTTPNLPSLPDSPAGQQAQALLDALADGRPESLTHFAAEHFAARVLAERSAEERAKGLARVSHDLGAGTLEHVDIQGPNALTMRLRAASSVEKLAWVLVRRRSSRFRFSKALVVRMDFHTAFGNS